MVIHLLILIMAYTLNVSIQSGVDLETAITPLHAAIMSDNWTAAYYLMRDNVLAELPWYSMFEKLFLRRSGMTWDSVLYDVVKTSLCGSLSYLLCRFNLLISSENHPVIHYALTYLWTSLSMFGSMLLITLFQTFQPSVRNIMCIGTLLCSLVLVSLLVYLNLHDILSFSRIFLENIKVLLAGTFDSFYYYVVSCFIFDILHNYIADQVMLIMLILLTSCIAGLLCSGLKNKCMF